MRSYSVDDIRRCFSTSTDFNEIFDVFQAALAQKVRDLDPYRLLFWNSALTTDEVRLFGEKLAGEFPDLAFDVYLWLASVFEVTTASRDNYELAVHYYMKAASARPEEPDPYLDACDCYDPDLNIPPLSVLIEFVRRGLEHVHNPNSLYRRLGHLHDLAGDHEMGDVYRQTADETGPGESSDPLPA
jgi:hypothetical protein